MVPDPKGPRAQAGRAHGHRRPGHWKSHQEANDVRQTWPQPLRSWWATLPRGAMRAIKVVRLNKVKRITWCSYADGVVVGMHILLDVVGRSEQ